MVDAADHTLMHAKRKAISALLVYLILERGREQQMANAISHVIRSLGTTWSTWRHIEPYTSVLFGGLNSPSTDPLIVLLSPYIGWDDALRSKDNVVRWATAALAVPYTEEVGRDIASALVQIACWGSLLPHIPTEIWTWLKKHSTLPPPYQGGRMLITGDTVRYIQGLGDIEIFRSYLCLVWSERCYIEDVCVIGDWLREDFCGIGMWGHREDLIKRLDKVLEDCDQESGPNEDLGARYQMLREVLLEVETKATKILIGTPRRLSLSIRYTESSTNVDVHRIPLNVHLFFASPLSVICPQASPVFRSSGYPSL